jgi:hypothetical protein
VTAVIVTMKRQSRPRLRPDGGMAAARIQRICRLSGVR